MSVPDQLIINENFEAKREIDKLALKNFRLFLGLPKHGAF